MNGSVLTFGRNFHIFYTFYSLIGLSPYWLIHYNYGCQFYVNKKSRTISFIVDVLVISSCIYFFVKNLKIANDVSDIIRTGMLAVAFVEIVFIITNSQIYAKKLCTGYYKLSDFRIQLFRLYYKKHILRRKTGSWLIWCRVILAFSFVTMHLYLLFRRPINLNLTGLIVCFNVISIYRFSANMICSHFILETAEVIKQLNELLLSISFNGKKIICIENRIAPKADVYIKLENIAKIYVGLVDNIKTVTKAFELVALTKLTWIFVTMISSINFLVERLNHANSSGETSEAQLTTFTWILSVIFEFIADIYICVGFTKETSETLSLFEDIKHELGCKSLSYKQVELFQLQGIFHNIKFVVYGLFPLDWTLIYSMTTGVTTYLVYLIQFRVKEENQNAFGV